MLRTANVIVAVAITLVSGCTSLQVPFFSSSTPLRTVRAYTEANACIGQEARRYLGDRRLLLLVDRLDDKTMREGTPLSSELANSGGLIFKSVLVRSLGVDKIVVPMSSPLSFRLFEDGGVPVGPAFIRNLQAEYGLKNNDQIIVVAGGFTGYDRVESSSGGGVGGRVTNETGGVSLNMGKSSQAGRVTLDLHFGTLVPNQLLGTIELTGTPKQFSSSYQLEVKVSGFGAGARTERLVADGLHGVQQSMLEAAHYLFWDALLPASLGRDCLEGDRSPVVLADAARRFNELSHPGKIKAIQRLLNEVGGVQVGVDGVLGQSTWRAVRAFERGHGLPPASKGDLDAVHAHLLRARASPSRSG